MTKRMMDSLYKELNEIGLGFQEEEVRYRDKYYGRNSDLSVNGSLYNLSGIPFDLKQLAKVLEIAKAKKTYFVVMPEKTAVKRGLFVSFLQKGLFDTLEVSTPLVTSSLRRNFSYVQEDEKAMKLDAALQELSERVEEFKKRAYDRSNFLNTCGLIRSAMKKEGHILEHDSRICEYMSDVFEIHKAEAFCKAIYCMRMVC